MAYGVKITPEGLRHLQKLPEKVRHAVVETIFGSVAENPRRAGKLLRGELEGLFSARRGDYRVIYEIEERSKTVRIIRAQHRGVVYRPRGRKR